MPTFHGSEADIHYDRFGEGHDVVWVSGGGSLGSDWHPFQMPFFEARYRNTTFDNRGIGATTSRTEMPWPVEVFARDTAELIEAVCDPPVIIVGLSMGGFTVLQLAIDRPELIRVAVAMGCAASGHEGWLGDYMGAEVEYRRNGGRLDGLMSTIHYATQLYPAAALGDPELWPVIRERLGAAWEEDNEKSLIGQWQACIDFDITDRLPGCTTPLHVFVFEEDVQAPPRYGRKVAELVPGAQLHSFPGMGHCSLYAHKPDVVNAEIRKIVEAL